MATNIEDDQKLDESLSVYNERELEYLDRFLPKEDELYQIILECNFVDEKIENKIKEKQRWINAKGSMYGWNVVKPNHRVRPVDADEHMKQKDVKDSEQANNNKSNQGKNYKKWNSGKNKNPSKYSDQHYSNTTDDYNNDYDYYDSNNYTQNSYWYDGYYNNSAYQKNNYYDNNNNYNNANYNKRRYQEKNSYYFDNYNSNYYTQTRYQDYYSDNNWNNRNQNYYDNSYYKYNNYIPKYKQKRRPNQTKSPYQSNYYYNNRYNSSYYNNFKNRRNNNFTFVEFKEYSPENVNQQSTCNENNFETDVSKVNENSKTFFDHTMKESTLNNNLENFDTESMQEEKIKINANYSEKVTSNDFSINPNLRNILSLENGKTANEEIFTNKISNNIAINNKPKSYQDELEEINVNKTNLDNLRNYFERLKMKTNVNENNQQNGSNFFSSGLYEKFANYTSMNKENSLIGNNFSQNVFEDDGSSKPKLLSNIVLNNQHNLGKDDKTNNNKVQPSSLSINNKNLDYEKGSFKQIHNFSMTISGTSNVSNKESNLAKTNNSINETNNSLLNKPLIQATPYQPPQQSQQIPFSHYDYLNYMNQHRYVYPTSEGSNFEGDSYTQFENPYSYYQSYPYRANSQYVQFQPSHQYQERTAYPYTGEPHSYPYAMINPNIYYHTQPQTQTPFPSQPYIYNPYFSQKPSDLNQ